MNVFRPAACLALPAVLLACVPVRYADCGAGTVRLAEDATHCGGCHSCCPEGASCVDGVCVVPDGVTVCTETVDESGDVESGDARGIVNDCEADDPSSSRRATVVRSRVVDLRGDPRHCGACANVCPDGSDCADGRCTPRRGTQAADFEVELP
ncbi:MAG: hypothetical protein HY905_15410 [Deltaproteobacteria bacterium]|nr:hypothetical protein [Deltaproteobacteria bacterium]